MELHEKAEADAAPDLASMFISRATTEERSESMPNPAVFINLLRQGIPGSTVKILCQHIPRALVQSAVGTDASNFSKLLKKPRLNQKQTEELNDLTSLWQELRQFFLGDSEMITEWIDRPNPGLDGAVPSSLMGSQYGRGVVREILDEMKYGDFS